MIGAENITLRPCQLLESHSSRLPKGSMLIPHIIQSFCLQDRIIGRIPRRLRCRTLFLSQPHFINLPQRTVFKKYDIFIRILIFLYMFHLCNVCNTGNRSHLIGRDIFNLVHHCSRDPDGIPSVVLQKLLVKSLFMGRHNNGI